MGTRSEALASKVEKANNDLLKAAESSTDPQWRATCVDGDWTQGFAAYHAASSVGGLSQLIQAVANGATPPAFSLADVNAGNEATRKEYDNCTKQEVLDFVRRDGPAAVQMVRGLSDAQLDRTHKVVTEFPEMSVEQMVDTLLVTHPSGHVASMRG